MMIRKLWQERKQLTKEQDERAVVTITSKMLQYHMEQVAMRR